MNMSDAECRTYTYFLGLRSSELLYTVFQGLNFGRINTDVLWTTLDDVRIWHAGPLTYLGEKLSVAFLPLAGLLL